MSDRSTGHYDTWTRKRVDWMKTHFGDAFEGRSVLDIGGGKGQLARLILELGARSVEVVEGRMSNIPRDAVDARLTFNYCNLERGLLTFQDEYDIVLNLGTIHHLVNWERVLVESIFKARELLFMETEVIDADSEYCRYVIEDARLYDQSMSGIGARPSEYALESIFRSIRGLDCDKVVDGALNADFRRYDWQNTFSGKVEDGLRRFYVARKAPDFDRAQKERIFADLLYYKTLDAFAASFRASATARSVLDKFAR